MIGDPADHAATIRHALVHAWGTSDVDDDDNLQEIHAECEAALAALDALVADLRLVRAHADLLEQSQIPFIPRGAQEKIERLEGERDALVAAHDQATDALRYIDSEMAGYEQELAETEPAEWNGGSVTYIVQSVRRSTSAALAGLSGRPHNNTEEKP